MTDAERDEFLRDVLAGLSESPRRLPGKYIWDEAGSVLFDRICDHPDYYPMRGETALLLEVAREAAGLLGPNATIVEYGSGASRKIRTLLDALDRPARYVAIDISRDFLEDAVRRLAADYPEIETIPVCADFSKPIRLPFETDGPMLGYFSGTSIGNIAPSEAQAFLARARETLRASRFLIGADPTQDEDRLRGTYGGCGGLMPALHRNLLTRLKRDLDARIDEDAFRHEARILHEPFRVEAHLVASRASAWRLDGRSFAFEAGQSVRTDTSHKYPPDAFRALAGQAGWTPERLWLHPEGSFALHLLRG